MPEPTPNKNDNLMFFVAALVIALIAWPLALYSAHSAVFRADGTSGNSRTIFAIVVASIALISTWLAVFFGGKQE